LNKLGVGKNNTELENKVEAFDERHDTKHNDIQHHNIPNNDTHHNDPDHNDTQYNDTRIMTLSKTIKNATLSITALSTQYQLC
jgi:hypothetical protein